MVQLCLLSGSDDGRPCDSTPASSRKSHSSRQESNATSSVLPFSVVYFSGQDENFPASELNKGVLGRGWQTPRFCSFPQEIVVELESPSHISNLQILSHEYKIASKVEIFVSSDMPWVTKGTINQMKELGFVALDPNDKTKHQTRELKQISIDCEAKFVRLLLHTCFVNRMNTHNQVGIVALIITGRPLSNQQSRPVSSEIQIGKNPWVPLSPPKVANIEAKEVAPKAVESEDDDTLHNLDPQTVQEIVKLRKEKEEAVQSENYDEAKRLKNLIERRIANAARIKELELRKQVAVLEEDYDCAKSCKLEIQRIRDSYDVDEVTKVDRDTQTNMKLGEYGLENPGNPMEETSSQDAWTQTKDNDTPTEQSNISEDDVPQPSNDIPKQDPYVMDIEKELDSVIRGEDTPTVEENNLTPEPVSEAILKEVEAILVTIDQYHLDCLYSKHWQLREKGLLFLGKQIQSVGVVEPFSTIRSMVKVLNRALNDKVTNVFHTALQVMRVFVEKYRSELSGKEMHSTVSSLIVTLLEKLGHSNVRAREATSEALLFLAMAKEVGLSVISPLLLKPVKNQATWKPVLGRLQLLFIAIPMFGLQPQNQQGFSLDALMAFIIHSFGSPNGDVRTAAVKATVEAYRIVGPPLEKFLKGVKPAIHEVLIEKFEKVSGASPAKKETEENTYEDVKPKSRKGMTDPHNQEMKENISSQKPLRSLKIPVKSSFQKNYD